MQSFKIMPVGFAVSFKIDTKNYNKKILKANLLAVKKLAVAIAGPCTNLILILIFILFGKEEILHIETNLLIYANILVFIFNMLPIYPLDGGRIFKNISYILFGKISALEITNVISNIIAIVLTLLRHIYQYSLQKYLIYVCVNIYLDYNNKRK